MSSFAVGCDPELFLTKKDSKEEFVSSIGKFGGTKEEPLQLANLENGFCIQEDNVALEFNIPPSATEQAFVTNMRKAIDAITALTGEKGLCPSFTASVSMPEEEMQSEAAWIFGCDPDMNAWTGDINPAPFCDDPLLRSAGGHIHMETPKEFTKAQRFEVIKWADIVIGSVLSELDPDKRRMKLYGKPGACRIKPYGVEYRTPSNFWVDKEYLWKWVWNAANTCVNLVAEGKTVDAKYYDLVYSSIVKGDVETRNKLYTSFGDWKSWFSQITTQA